MGLERAFGPGYITTQLDAAVNWARANSVWPYIFGTACCAIEFMATAGSHHDIARFGSEVLRFSPRQADCLMVAGTINHKMVPVLKTIYEQMSEPKWVIAIGACACSGGMYQAYNVLKGIDQVLPVDVYVPGCPPRPEQIFDALLKLQAKIRTESVLDKKYFGE